MDLPFVDEHSVDVLASAARAWSALAETAPTRGFRIVARDAPRLLALAGSHPFSQYALTFRIAEDGPAQCRVRAETRADFPGARGKAYRALVIGTGAHRVVMRRMLARLKRAAER